MQSLGYRKIAYVKTFWRSTHPHITGGKKGWQKQICSYEPSPTFIDKIPGWSALWFFVMMLSCPSTFTASQLAWPLKKSWFISLGNFYIWVRQDRLILLGLLKLLIYFTKVFKTDSYSLAKFASSPLNSTIVPIRFVDLSLCLELC